MSKTEEAKTKTKTGKKLNLSVANVAKMSNVRIIQKHLVYVIGLSANLTNKDLLSKHEYFGQYGNIAKIVVNKNKAYNPTGVNGPSYSAYISYSLPIEASLAILAIDNIVFDEHTIRASFGTTKYCTYFLKNQECSNKDCLYLHCLSDDDDIINKVSRNLTVG